MKLCKDCWFLWVEKGICTNRNITKINPINDTPMSLAIDLRYAGGKGYCNPDADYWRPIDYSPNKIYSFVITCPNCGHKNRYDLEASGEKGIRICWKCKRQNYLPKYGVNFPGKNTIFPAFIKNMEKLNGRKFS